MEIVGIAGLAVGAASAIIAWLELRQSRPPPAEPTPITLTLTPSTDLAASPPKAARFFGRAAALQRLDDYLTRPKVDPRPLVVTGTPGSGKTAILEHLESTRVGVNVFVQARHLTIVEIAERIAALAFAPAPASLSELPDHLRSSLPRDPVAPFTIVIDSLDECDGGGARQVLQQVVQPIIESCWDIGVQFILGMRRHSSDGDLLKSLTGATVLDLDEDQFFSLQDVADWALFRLQSANGVYQSDGPHAPDGTARTLADKIAIRAGHSFLIAELIANRHAIYDQAPTENIRADPESPLRGAVEGYISSLQPVDGVSATDALTALAYAHDSGFSIDTWCLAIASKTGHYVDAVALWRFARSAAANLLRADERESRHRLYHQEVRDCLLQTDEELDPQHITQHRVLDALLELGRTSSWSADEYLTKSLPSHARALGRIDDILCCDQYLAHAHLGRLVAASTDAISPKAKARAHLLALAPEAARLLGADRLAALELAALIYRLPAELDAGHDVPFRALWSERTDVGELAHLEGHTAGVNHVLAINETVPTLLASASNDGTIRLWDVTTYQQYGDSLAAHTGPVLSLAFLHHNEEDLLASGGSDGLIHIWDLATQGHPPIASVEGHPGGVLALAMLASASGSYIVSSGGDGALRTWRRSSSGWHPQSVLTSAWPADVYAAEVDNASIVLCASRSGVIRMLSMPDLVTIDQLHLGGAQPQRILQAPFGSHRDVAVQSDDNSIQILELGSQRLLSPARLVVEGRLTATIGHRSNGRNLVAIGLADGTIGLLDKDALNLGNLTGHVGAVRSLASVHASSSSEALLGSGGDDGTVRLWRVPDLRGSSKGRTRPRLHSTAPVLSMLACEVAGRGILIAGRSDGVLESRDLVTGDSLGITADWRAGGIVALAYCPKSHLVVSSHGDGSIRLRNPIDLEVVQATHADTGWLPHISEILVNGETVIVTGGTDGIVRFWDAEALAPTGALELGTGPVRGLQRIPSSSPEEDDAVLVALERSVHKVGPASPPQLVLHTERVRQLLTLKDNGVAVVLPSSVVWIEDINNHKHEHVEVKTGTIQVASDFGAGMASGVAIAGADRTVRLWPMPTAEAITAVNVKASVTRMASYGNTLAIATGSGLIALSVRSAQPH